MGNCMKKSKRSYEEEENETEEEIDQGTLEKASGYVKERDSGGKNDAVKVKIVMTREELEWLMTQLKNDVGSGKRSLEELLGVIEREKRRELTDGGWRPSLESIIEEPEV